MAKIRSALTAPSVKWEHADIIHPFYNTNIINKIYKTLL